MEFLKPIGTFTNKLWIKIKPVFEQILKCSYVSRLADGTLPHSWFSHYLSQDVLYLIDDSRALAVTAARTQDPYEMYFFLQLAKDGLDIERELQNDLLKHFSITRAREKSPAFQAYTAFLLDHAFHSPYPVAVTALLPCFWVYYNTGCSIYKNSVASNPYQKWINTYSGKIYMEYTRRFIQITENLGQKAEHETGRQMIHAFTEGTRYEFMTLEEATHH